MKGAENVAQRRIERLLVIAGAGDYPRFVVEGARKAGVPTVDVVNVLGSTARATRRAGDKVIPFSVGKTASGIKMLSSLGYDGAIMAGQINPLSLFRTRFEKQVLEWLKAMPAKNAHSIYGKVVEEFTKAGLEILPASSYMDEHCPGEGLLSAREPTEREMADIRHASKVARDIGRHDVGQTVLVKEGMVVAVEAFEGTNAAIKRGGRLGGKGAVVFKAAREGHDMRFDIPVVGLKTLKVMKSAGVSALAFQAGRLILLDAPRVIDYANRHSIAIVGVKTDLPPAPLRP